MTALVATSCASGNDIAAAEVTEVTFHADYPAYDSLDDLRDQADLVVNLKFTGESRTLLLNPVPPADPNDPVENPTLGVDPSLVAAAPTPPPIVATAYTATVTKVFKGNVHVGDTIEVKELGGTHDGVRYVSSEGVAINKRGAYLTFLAGTTGSPYSLLNPEEGKYPRDTRGAAKPLPSNEMPVTDQELKRFDG